MEKSWLGSLGSQPLFLSLWPGGGPSHEDGKTSRPTTLSRATGWLRFEKLDTTPIRLQSGKVFYDGAVLKLTLDQKGRAAALTTRVRAALKLDCYAASVAFDAAIAYDCKEQYRLQYNGT